MGRPITINVPHALGKDEARRRIAEGFRSAQQQKMAGLGALLSIREHWEQDSLHFEAGALGQVIRGRLDVLPDRVEIEIQAPDLLAAVAERLLATVDAKTRKLLE